MCRQFSEKRFWKNTVFVSSSKNSCCLYACTKHTLVCTCIGDLNILCILGPLAKAWYGYSGVDTVPDSAAWIENSWKHRKRVNLVGLRYFGVWGLAGLRLTSEGKRLRHVTSDDFLDGYVRYVTVQWTNCVLWSPAENSSKLDLAIWWVFGFFHSHCPIALQSELVHLVEPGHCQPTQRGGVHSDNAVNFHDINRFIGVTCWWELWFAETTACFWICSEKDLCFEGREKL